MSISNSVANGGKLDDCHSSIYSLADLTGLRWRTFSGALALPVTPSDDPVLLAFSKSLSQDILAVWRKKPNLKKSSSGVTQSHPFHDDDVSNFDLKKELWLFWWGNEDDPSIEDVGRTVGLTVESDGSWEDLGLSYECRTLLFKAIHNLIERCLLSEKFVRIGKWFLRPYNKEDDEEKFDRLSVSFMFFLRGENTVCATVDIAQHQAIERISSQYLYQVANNAASKNVILSPYGLQAMLTGQWYKSPHDQAVKTVIDEWKGFYPVEFPFDRPSHDDHDGVELPMPLVVEVLLSGVRMNYPSTYVLVPAEKQTPVKEIENRPWNADKRGMDCASSHQGDLTSIGSFQDSMGMSMSEAASSPISESFKDGASINNESTSSMVKKLISRVVNASQMSSEPEVNGVLPHIHESHSSPDNTLRWPKLNCQFKRARLKMNYLPLNDDDPGQVSGKLKHLNDNISQVDNRRKVEKQKPSTTVPFHRSSLESNPPQNSCPQPMPPPFQPQENNTMIGMYQPQQVGFVNYPQFCMGQEEIQKVMEPQVPTDPMYLPNTNEMPLVQENFQTSNQLDQGGFQYGITDEAIANTSVGEIKEHISVWKKIKLPKDDHKQNRLQKMAGMPPRPCLVQETLESDCTTPSNALRSYKRMKSSFSEIQKDCAWDVDSKRRKIEEENVAAETGENATSSTSGPLGDGVEQVVPQHVWVGPITGELAGMTVLSDPYEFEDDVKDIGNAAPFNSPFTADINLKQGGGVWSNNGNPETNAMDMMGQKNGHLSSLLKQNTQPFSRVLSLLDDPMGMDKPASSSLMEQRDLTVSAFDLDKIFNDDDDTDDVKESKVTPGKNNQVKFEPHGTFPSSAAQSFLPGVSGLGLMNTGDMGQVLNGGNTVSVETLGSLAGKMARSQYGKRYEDTKRIGHEVYSKEPLSKQPLTDRYAPLPLKSLSRFGLEGRLPHTFTYTPSWQVTMESYVGPPNAMASMDASDDVSFMQTCDVPTPVSHSYSVNTPASVPQQSPLPPQQMPRTPRTPRTPRGSASPATSTPNPATHSRFPVHTPQTSVSSSAAQSDIGNCRASSIYVNLMLSDSVLNLFRDISFDQCPMCVCNDNIRSRDVDLGYLPSMTDNLSDGQYPCSCGFSAVRNRTLSVGTGLFLEDELEIVGKDLESDIIKSRDALRKPLNGSSEAMINFAVRQAPNPYLKLNTATLSKVKCQVYNVAAQQDIMEACVEAINGGITVLETGSQPKIQLHNCKNVIHHWIDTRLMKCASSVDMYQMMQFLKPVLQNAIQRKKSERSFNFIQRVNGPLTWQEFCKDTGGLEPLPVPMLLVGQAHDWMTVSPFALDYWEKLYLEPYAGITNISYLVICPEVEHVSSAAKFFFNELSQVYDLCRLGNHKPLIRNSTDNIICVSNKMVNNMEVSETHKTPGDTSNPESTQNNHVGNQSSRSVESYIAACRDILFPLFNISPLGVSNDSQEPQGTGPLTNSLGKPASSRPSTPLPPKLKAGKDYLQQFTSKQNTNDNATVVLYFVDPFIGENCSAFSIAVWKCYAEIIKSLPETKRNSVAIQLVAVEDILQYAGSTHKSSVSAARSLAFSSYFQCRHRMSNQTSVRKMTAFGPATTRNEAAQENKLKLALPAMHSPAYVLAGSKNMQKDSLVTEKKGKECNILYVTYCLSHDQKWLIASATDQDGEMLETFCVNIDVPPRRVSLRRKNRICIKTEAIKKLWNLCLSLITSTASIHWRIVVGRLGRLGHGEMQEWSKHLSRKNFSQLSKQVSTKCNQCMLNGAYKHPSIFSACLISLEPEGSFTILPDLVKLAPFGRSSNTGQQVQLKTPDDASCTHIYVFPTSSFVQTASGGTFQNDDFLSNGFPVFVEQDDIPLVDLLEATSPGGNAHQTDDIGHLKPQPDRLTSTDLPEEVVLQQQPLALGYMVSTAPTGPLPDSFWVLCPHAQSRCPVFLRFALHIQVSSDEVQNMGSGDSNDDHHQLDSHKTAQVLRYVMENYNALSWLTCDPVSRDRRSCLPIHYFVLTRLYHTIKEFT